MKLSIIIPVFNEQDYIEETIKKVLEFDSISAKKEIIVINDGSSDDTGKILKKLKEKNREIIVLENKVNAGKGAAVKLGLLKSRGDIVIIQDADLEYSPDNYPQLIEPFLKHKADVVYGSRFISNQPRRILYYWHYLGNLILTNLSNMLTNLNLTDMETGYKAFRGGLIRQIGPKLQSTRFGFEPEVTARLSKINGIKIYEVGISYWGRTYEEGKKIGWVDGVKAIWEIVKYNLLID